MVGWHLWLNGHEFGQTCGDSEGQGSLACCSPWGCKELDMTELTEQQQYVPPLRSLMHTVQTEVQVRIGKMTSEKELSVQFSSVAQLCLTLCNPMDCSTPGLPVLHRLPEFAQTHVHWVKDAIQPSHPLSCSCPPPFNLSQHQGLFQWISSLHHVAKVLELQLQHQSFQWIFRTDFL